MLLDASVVDSRWAAGRVPSPASSNPSMVCARQSAGGSVAKPPKTKSTVSSKLARKLKDFRNVLKSVKAAKDPDVINVPAKPSIRTMTSKRWGKCSMCKQARL